jgi:predicted negative regulator of RcsB-dependent stress response
VAQHLTEEEQVEKFKRWWADNGRSVIVGVVLALVGYFGWQTWQSQQQETREAASLLYEELSDAVARESEAGLSEEQRLKAASITEELKADYGNLLYSSNAALLMARRYSSSAESARRSADRLPDCTG